YPGYRIELTLIPCRVVQGADPTRVVQEGVRVAQCRLEAKLVVDLADPISVVVDVNRVQHIVAELKEVRATRRSLEGNVISNQRYRVWLVRANKRVHVGIVRNWVLGDLGRFSMGGHRLRLPLSGLVSGLDQTCYQRWIAIDELLLSDQHRNLRGCHVSYP